MSSARHSRFVSRRTARWCIFVAVLVAMGGTTLVALATTKPRTTSQTLFSDCCKGHTDAKLVNPWGLSFGPDTPAWVADNGTGFSTLYTGTTRKNAKKVPLNVSIPGGSPTGTVYNGSNAFRISAGGNSGPANFIFDSESGRITAWSQNVPPATQAQTVATVPGAIFKGLAIAKTEQGKARLYATDFHHGRVAVFDGKFNRVHHKGAFRDPRIPDKYAPFGIENLHGRILVTYAKQDAKAEDDVPGAHHGYVDVYSTGGELIKRLISRGPLNSPWGIAMTPRHWPNAARKLLVGNFGDGRINIFNPRTGKYLDTLRNKRGIVFSQEGLWALEFGNGVIGTKRTLLLTAGPDDEKSGVLVALRPYNP
jgi:uncharacterized protein (TIGR03118 family)